MTIKELNDYILHYLKKDRTQTAIMLTGEWGSGKTYYIENDLVPFLKKNKATSVVVSLYGLDDISMISKSIYMELRMSTARQLHDFRGIMFMIYRDSGVRDFDESDIEAMRQLLSLINKKCDIDNQWDKIQLMQIGWLKSNLNQFIEQMS